jgi:hypothetical protein
VTTDFGSKAQARAFLRIPKCGGRLGTEGTIKGTLNWAADVKVVADFQRASQIDKFPTWIWAGF